MQVSSLGLEDLLEEKVAIHFSIFCLENPMDKGSFQATVHGVTELDKTLESPLDCKEIQSVNPKGNQS